MRLRRCGDACTVCGVPALLLCLVAAPLGGVPELARPLRDGLCRPPPPRVLALRGGGPAEKIAEIEAEMRKTQKNKVVGPRPLAKLVSFLHSGELSTHPPRAAGLLLLYGVPRLL